MESIAKNTNKIGINAYRIFESITKICHCEGKEAGDIKKANSNTFH